jgi:hypothetical protein
MRRRDFIKAVVGSAAAWPLAVQAQQPNTVRRIGILMPFAETDPELKHELAAFVRQLNELGWVRAAISASSIAGRPATCSGYS